eukprot:GHVN01100952.1.p2 GENE.GHVN01100952.1~~GHVN01100952.1.p2  ORF type:complete len:109 (+),score=13.98 GHVN01100952.1:58-384(+)
MSKVIQISSKQELTTHIAASKVAVVDFFATWCAPCQIMAAKIDEWSRTTHSDITFLKVDVDELNDLAEEYDVSAIPTFKIFKDGKVQNTIVGANVPNLMSAIDTVKAG